MSAVSVSGTARSSSVPDRARSRRPARLEPPVGDEHPDVSTAYSGMPSARATIARTASSGSPGTSPASSARIAGSGSGSSGRRDEVAPARRPSPGGASSSSGRASVTTRIGSDSRPLEEVVDEVERARVRPVEVLEHEHHRAARGEPLEEESASAANSWSAETVLAPTPSSGQERGLHPGPLARRPGCARRASPRPSRGSSPRRPSPPGRSAPRTISPSAQNVIPSPYAGDRPWCHQTCSTTPSRYFSNSQASRLLPMPAGPVTETSRARPSRAVAWNRSLSSRSSSSRPTNGASSVSLRPRPPRSATTRRARQAGTGASLPLSWTGRRPASKAIAADAARYVASPTSTVPGSRDRLEPGRRVDEVARDHPLVRGAERHGRLAGQDARAGADPRPKAADRARAGRARPGRPARRRPRGRWASPRRPSPRRR